MLIDEAVASGWLLREVVCSIIIMAGERFSNGGEKAELDNFHS